MPEDEAAAMTSTGMPPADYVELEVEDTGTGMTPEIMEKIFEPFFSTKELGKGTGLGLSTVYGIIKQTGGFVYPESEVGRGTVFHIFLPRLCRRKASRSPRSRPPRWSRTSPATAHPPGRGRGHVRAFSARALRATGYEVFEADSGEEALEVLADSAARST